MRFSISRPDRYRLLDSSQADWISRTVRLLRQKTILGLISGYAFFSVMKWIDRDPKPCVSFINKTEWTHSVRFSLSRPDGSLTRLQRTGSAFFSSEPDYLQSLPRASSSPPNRSGDDPCPCVSFLWRVRSVVICTYGVSYVLGETSNLNFLCYLLHRGKVRSEIKGREHDRILE